MITAYILLMVEAGQEEIAINKLLENDEVKEANIVYGQYDIVMKIRVKNIKALEEFILKNVRPIKEIQESSTLISTHE